MAGMLTGEAADLDVVPHDVVLRRKLVHCPFKELLLVVPARPPRKHAAHVEVLANDVPHHVGWRNTFGRRFVMRAAGGMHMMIARDPAEISQLDPALHAERLALGGTAGLFSSARCGHGDGLL